MRRLAFLAAASLAFIAISEPPSAEARGAANSKCSSACYDKIAEKYGRPWSYGDLAPADQRSFVKCANKCDIDFPRDRDRDFDDFDRRKRVCDPDRGCHLPPPEGPEGGHDHGHIHAPNCKQSKCDNGNNHGKYDPFGHHRGNGHDGAWKDYWKHYHYHHH
tara:strand:+ start:563 stop:1045 length:483 start_codon:yes stop_codon:yes gene_type:complete